MQVRLIYLVGSLKEKTNPPEEKGFLLTGCLWTPLPSQLCPGSQPASHPPDFGLTTLHNHVSTFLNISLIFTFMFNRHPYVSLENPDSHRLLLLFHKSFSPSITYKRCKIPFNVLYLLWNPSWYTSYAPEQKEEACIK